MDHRERKRIVRIAYRIAERRANQLIKEGLADIDLEELGHFSFSIKEIGDLRSQRIPMEKPKKFGLALSSGQLRFRAVLRTHRLQRADWYEIHAYLSASALPDLKDCLEEIDDKDNLTTDQIGDAIRDRMVADCGYERHAIGDEWAEFVVVRWKHDRP
jgi:hypothetical protein